MSSSRPSPSSRDDQSFSSRGSSSGGASRPGASRPDGSRADSSASRAPLTPAAPPKMNTPRPATGAGVTGASANGGEKAGSNTAAKAGATGGGMKWAAMGGLGVLALGGYMLMNHKTTSAAPGSTSTTGTSSRSSNGSAPAQPGNLTVFVGADVSKSVTPNIRETSMDGLKFALKQAVAGGTSLHFVFYDKSARTRPNTVEFYEPRDLDEVATEFKKYTSRPERGTTQADAIKRLRQEAAELPSGTPYAFVLLTDGEDYDRKATREQAQELSGQANFRGLVVIGAQMESKARIYLRDQIQDSLAPLGKKRLICGPEVSEHDADTFQSLMNG